ncbi:hypothetical protein LNP74_12695 [Klebsiella pneumoniae subsp. pneumoniae]|nr:hypothetical protein [Klebsiella pneumoniae subsp. pneumoniae]
MSHNDTIVAQATPPGRGVWASCVSPALRRATSRRRCWASCRSRAMPTHLPFNDVDGTPLDQGIALWFPGPNSFTGEDVLELQGHGGPVILDLLPKRILTLPGAASPGRVSFPERAFLNDTASIWRRQRPSPTLSTPVQSRRRARR